jgi:hypothetical protein
MKCPHCGYEWEPRIPNPKTCPCCKRVIALPKAYQEKQQERKQILAQQVDYTKETGYTLCYVCHKQVGMIRIDIPGEPPRHYCIQHAAEKIASLKQLNQYEVAAQCQMP